MAETPEFPLQKFLDLCNEYDRERQELMEDEQFMIFAREYIDKHSSKSPLKEFEDLRIVRFMQDRILDPNVTAERQDTLRMLLSMLNDRYAVAVGAEALFKQYIKCPPPPVEPPAKGHRLLTRQRSYSMSDLDELEKEGERISKKVMKEYGCTYDQLIRQVYDLEDLHFGKKSNDMRSPRPKLDELEQRANSIDMYISQLE